SAKGSIVNLCLAFTPLTKAKRSPWKSISVPAGRSRKATNTLSLGCICKKDCLLSICLFTGAKFENFIHYYPFFPRFGTGYRLLEFPGELFPCFHVRVCLIRRSLFGERKIILCLNDHKHAVGKPEDFHLGNTRIQDGLPN